MPSSARRLRFLSRHLSRGDLRGGVVTTAAAEDGRVAVAAPDAVVITRIRAFRVAPYGTPLCIVKVETSRPGVHGVGCATFTQRQELVAQAVEQYLEPFLRGRDVQQTTDIWRAATQSSYWRSGPVLNNAVSGVDQALWDIKGKLAGVPVHDLFGGKVRQAATVYVTVGGATDEETIAQAAEAMRRGFTRKRFHGVLPALSLKPEVPSLSQT